jgi:hypothetical protein
MFNLTGGFIDNPVLTPQELLEIQRLNEWKEENGYNLNRLALATDDYISNLSLILRGKRAIPDSFKWRFTLAFGDAARDRIFQHATSVPTPVVEPA